MDWHYTDITYDGLELSVLCDDGDYIEIFSPKGDEITHIFTDCVQQLIFDAARQQDAKDAHDAYWDARIGQWEERMEA